MFHRYVSPGTAVQMSVTARSAAQKSERPWGSNFCAGRNLIRREQPPFVIPVTHTVEKTSNASVSRAAVSWIPKRAGVATVPQRAPKRMPLSPPTHRRDSRRFSLPPSFHHRFPTSLQLFSVDKPFAIFLPSTVTSFFPPFSSFFLCHGRRNR